MQRGGGLRLLLAAAWACCASAPAQACESRLAGPSAEVVLRAPMALNPAGGDPVLDDGRPVRLRGLLPRAEQGAAAALAALQQGGLSFTQTAALAAMPPDRWGRRLGDGWHDTTGENLALTMLTQGLALAWPSELPPNCRILYLEAEAKARDNGRGLWGSPQGRLLEAADGAAVAARAGEIAVMQGRVAHVGQTRRALYLNFGERGVGASAEVPLSVWRGLERAGLSRAALRGRMVRLRGVALTGRPARLLINDASHLEWLP
jgi:hypothetical protein